VSIVLILVNPSTGIPLNQTHYLDKGKYISKYYSSPTPKCYGTKRDSFLARNFLSSIVSITHNNNKFA